MDPPLTTVFFFFNEGATLINVDEFQHTHVIMLFFRRQTSQVDQAHFERSAYINLFLSTYIMSWQNIKVCMKNATKTL